ncbi:MAG: hypothetical protein GY716_25135 [bacterium]|nr:hypothetical protein [bacterium]
MRRSSIAAGLLASAMLLGGSAWSGDFGVRYTTELDPKNFAHASFLGSGIYSVDGRLIYIIRIKAALRVRSEDVKRWGLRATLRPTLGFYDFKTGDEDKFGLPSSIGSLSLLPGLEFRVPIRDNWRLDPFVEGGPAWEFDGNSVTWIYGFGIKSRAEFSWLGGKLLLFNTLLWAGNRESDIAPRDDFAVLETKVDWRFPIRGSFFGHPTSLGPFGRSEAYFDALAIDPPDGAGIEIERRYEIGLTWGTRERAKKWKIPIPRLGASYRFGEGAETYRIVLTSRF